MFGKERENYHEHLKILRYIWAINTLLSANETPEFRTTHEVPACGGLNPLYTDKKTYTNRTTRKHTRIEQQENIHE